MIEPSQQWAVQIDVTNACHLHCSNCTRSLDHAKPRYFMSPECFRQALMCVREFPTLSKPCVGSHRGRRKVIGMIGGEPLLHPQFPELVNIFCELVPQARFRGLWTSKDWKVDSHPKWGPMKPQVERLLGPKPTHDARGPSNRHACGYLNWNMHLPSMNVQHQPILVASKEAVSDERMRWELIEDCWVQREWSATCTPNGYYFCEVAAHLDIVLHGGTLGLPLEPRQWEGSLFFKRDEQGVPRPHGKFAEQVRKSCEFCGACLHLAGRRDNEDRDDISPGNLKLLEGSPRVKKGDVVVYDISIPYDQQRHEDGWDPKQYVKGYRPSIDEMHSFAENESVRNAT